MSGLDVHHNNWRSFQLRLSLLICPSSSSSFSLFLASFLLFSFFVSFHSFFPLCQSVCLYLYLHFYLYRGNYIKIFYIYFYMYSCKYRRSSQNSYSVSSLSASSCIVSMFLSAWCQTREDNIRPNMKFQQSKKNNIFSESKGKSSNYLGRARPKPCGVYPVASVGSRQASAVQVHQIKQLKKSLGTVRSRRKSELIPKSPNSNSNQLNQ